MEKPVKEHEIQTKLAPPDEANVSMVLNGIGNGMMLGAAPYLVIQMLCGIRGTDISRQTHKFGAFATIGGCLLGGWFGAREARRIEHYRNSISQEIAKLSDKVDAKAAQWSEKVETTSAHPISR